MCAGAGGGDGGRFFVVADAALSVLGTGFSGVWFFIDDPVAVVMGGFIFDGIDAVAVGSGAGVPVVGGVGCPCVTKGVGVWGGGNDGSFLCIAIVAFPCFYLGTVDLYFCIYVIIPNGSSDCLGCSVFTRALVAVMVDVPETYK